MPKIYLFAIIFCCTIVACNHIPTSEDINGEWLVDTALNSDSTIKMCCQGVRVSMVPPAYQGKTVIDFNGRDFTVWLPVGGLEISYEWKVVNGKLVLSFDEKSVMSVDTSALDS